MSKRHYFLDEAGKLSDDGGEPLPIPDLPVVYIEAADEAEAKQKVLRLNSCYGVLDAEGFAEFTAGLDVDWDELMLPSGDLFDLGGIMDGDGGESRKSLAERFIVPPLSVFRASAGYWQERKRQWLALGIRSENGRDDGMLRHMAALAEKAGGGKLVSESIFDPVLCEIMYRWFCPAGGKILDPFAGGSVRGLVAGRLGFLYTGIDQRDEQIAAKALTVAEGFVKSRKIGKVHQNILVFVKGDPARAAAKCKVDMDEIAAAIDGAAADEDGGTEASA